MSLGIYKPGQGYWTRVLTAVGLGVFCLTGIAWLWAQTAALPVPINEWTLTLVNGSGAIEPGQTVQLFANAEDTQPIGAAAVQSLDSAGRSLVIRDVVMNAGNSPTTVTLVSAPGYDASVTGRFGQPAFQILYVQAAMAAILLLLSATLIYWVAGVRHNTNEFFIAVDNEMKKVNWSTRREIIGSTWVVVTVCVTLTAILFGIDLAFGTFFRAIGILKA